MNAIYPKELSLFAGQPKMKMYKVRVQILKYE